MEETCRNIVRLTILRSDMTAYHRRVLERYRVLRRTWASWGQFLKLHGPQWLWVGGANAVIGLLSEAAGPF